MSAIGRRMNKLKSKLLSVRNGPGAVILPPHILRLHFEFAHKFNGGHMGARKVWLEYLPQLKYHNPAIPMIVNRTHDNPGPATLSVYVKVDDASHPPPVAAPTTTVTGGGGAPLLAAPGAQQDAAAAEAKSKSESESTGGKAAGEKDKAPAPAPAPAAPKEAESSGVDPWAHLTSKTDGSAKAPPAGRGERLYTINMKHVKSTDIFQQFLQMTKAEPVEPTAEDLEEMERMEKLKAQAEEDRKLQKKYRDNIKAEKKMLERARQEADALKQD